MRVAQMEQEESYYEEPAYPEPEPASEEPDKGTDSAAGIAL